jgi:hypothetical protein
MLLLLLSLLLLRRLWLGISGRRWITIRRSCDLKLFTVLPVGSVSCCILLVAGLVTWYVAGWLRVMLRVTLGWH